MTIHHDNLSCFCLGLKLAVKLSFNQRIGYTHYCAIRVNLYEFVSKAELLNIQRSQCHREKYSVFVRAEEVGLPEL